MKKYLQTKWLLLLLIGGGVALATSGRFLKISQSMENFAAAYRIINNQYVDETDPNQLMRIGIDSMLGHMDPYTNYFSEAQMVQVRMGVKGGWDGIGIELTKNDGQIVIKELIEDTPAEKNDLRVGDVLLKIDGTVLKDRKIEDVSQTLQGKAGTKVSIEVMRPSTGKVRELLIERTNVTKKNVPYYGMLDDETGYIVLTTFSQRAGGNVQDAFKALQAEYNPKQVILDLRNNGGGFLIEAVNICNIFLSKGNEIVYTRAKIPEWDRSFKTLNTPIDTEIPLIVLMNGGSASASEIVAGALQDMDRAVLLGRSSFGKGLVQNTKDIGYSSKVKLTTAKYYIPSGRCVQALNYKNGVPVKVADSLRQEFVTKSGRKVYDGKGLEPDYKVEEAEKSVLLKALIQENLIFDYANRYREEHDSIVPAKEFNLSEQAFDDFVLSATEKWLNYKTNTEKALDKLEKKAQQENTYADLATQFKQSKAKIKAEKVTSFEKNKTEVKEYLEQEIVGRYYYMTGQVENRLARDTDVAEAIKLFKDKERFEKLLKP
ncbi:MAG: Putative carboxy-terminal processing protease (EC [uncultured Aureispira sp.]|uniref:Carboxy-terminal processing protease (EC) n=1 Tax=uncultured Aureispira sp. TaxID=1331704 RepID=A0A6S6TNZ7_9BACT|nr:MAG: Putative carboxy-terminal processing protease (EC [uncultured Aureispira sp.]